MIKPNSRKTCLASVKDNNATIQMRVCAIDQHTLNDGQKNNNDEEEKGNVEEDSVDFIIVAIG